jgi:Flp pilus assembly protein TadD
MGADGFFEEGKRFFVEGKLRESISAFTKAVEGGYEPRISYLSRGVAYLRLRESDKAIADFSRVIHLDSNNPRAYYFRGIAHAQEKDFEKAVADFSDAIRLKPDNGAAVFARGAAYIEIGKPEEAVRDIKNASNYLAAVVQGYADMMGDRTHLDKVLAVLEGEKRADVLEISQSEFETIKKWLQKGGSGNG